ncbi:hypothetical protein DCAR_0936149 [Daucus carota subsp. sativus]|uniref:Histidine kinase domain-containing protein n=1 Tax=Daucus carota subsp. sativus TaxID=79200 RepID=A0AAF0Y3E8_DAUCS|nr:PREDICTED: chloroplast sensor kinase, chloroplastic isoform X2 [Daucus carota subsp. sativus]WOH16591.1 hypothetical protein DCAR_0936149 [Daucus carota subsp. sativus]
MASSSLFCYNYLTNSQASLTTFPNKLPRCSAIFAASSVSSINSISQNKYSSISPKPVCDDDERLKDGEMASCAASVAAAIRKASNSPVEFMQRSERKGSGELLLPSSDFVRLCVQQLDLFRRIVHPDAVLSVYVRPAGSYVMDQLELRRVHCFPGHNDADDIIILMANFSVPTGLRAAEASLSNRKAQFVPDFRSVVFPMVKHPFVVGFLVAELPKREQENGGKMKHYPLPEESYALPPYTDPQSWGIETFKQSPTESYLFTADQKLNAINISCSLAMAYVMDQKAMLLQQSTWQNNVRMSNLVEQIRGPLSSIRTLSKMLSVQVKRSEISYDIAEDILVQGDLLKDTLQQLQDAVYLTKANIMRYNEETLMKMNTSSNTPTRPQDSETTSGSTGKESRGTYFNFSSKDLEMPMPPLALAPVQQGIRPCNISDVLGDLVGALKPLAQKQQRSVELYELAQSTKIAVEELALRQAFSNLIEGALLRTHVGGKVEIVSTEAPAGGALVIIDDDGPDMHYMTQMHSLAPFGSDLLSEDMVEDNMTWNFVAGLTVAREILESYGCVIRVISPRTMDASLGVGGTRIELWLPTFSNSPSLNGPGQEA